MQSKKYWLGITLLMTILFPSIALADGISLLLGVISLKIFMLGQFWIVISESIYIRFIMKDVQYSSILGWTFLINLITTLIGAILIPGVIALIILSGLDMHIFQPLGSYPKSALRHDFLNTASTFLLTSNSIFVRVITGFLFIITYFMSSYIEGRYLYKLQKNTAKLDKKFLTKHSYRWNLISYLGLLIIYILGIKYCWYSPFCFII